jgi:hypothetical protein
VTIASIVAACFGVLFVVYGYFGHGLGLASFSQFLDSYWPAFRYALVKAVTEPERWMIWTVVGGLLIATLLLFRAPKKY